MEKVRKSMFLPQDVIDRVEKFQKDNYIGSFTDAVIQLLLKGLDADKKKGGK